MVQKKLFSIMVVGMISSAALAVAPIGPRSLGWLKANTLSV